LKRSRNAPYTDFGVSLVPFTWKLSEFYLFRRVYSHHPYVRIRSTSYEVGPDTTQKYRRLRWEAMLWTVARAFHDRWGLISCAQVICAMAYL